jgi:hypothetical protein
LSKSSTHCTSATVNLVTSMPLEKYCSINQLVFWFKPRSQL